MEKPVLPDFTRIQWASQAERDFWKPLFTEAGDAFTELERLSVLYGLRKAAYQFVPLAEVQSRSEWAHRNGLIMVPMHATHQSDSYISTEASGAPNALRVVFIKPEHYSELFPFNDDQKIGRLLGYPECCRKAFAETWEQGQIDNTYEQAANTRTINPLSSTLLRWMGIRLVSHMPCSYECTASAEYASSILDLGRKMGFAEQMQTINDVLRWPVYASRLFGISEMITPALKLVVRTDWTPTKEEFSFSGTYNKPSADLWTDNGFTGFANMRESHTLLLQAIDSTLTKDARLIDLGCGNGHLLHRFKTFWRPDVKIAGVDTNTDAIQRAPALIGKWYSTRIEDASWMGWNPTAALIMPGRLQEMDASAAEATRAALSEIPQVFCYSYSDWQKQGDLDALVERAGLGKIQILQKTPNLQVGVLTK